MTIHEGYQSFPALPYTVVTSGTFDGVHLGHQKIIQRIVELCRQTQGESVVLTYWPHPRLVLDNSSDIKLLNTFEEKSALMAELGIDHLVKINFTTDFSKLSSKEFITQILRDHIRTRMLVIGYDHRFGKNREGSFEYLKAHSHDFGFEVEEIPAQDVDEIAVSSTKIRHAINDGNVEKAHAFLGRPYELNGVVVKGDQIGRKLGYPTANLDLQTTAKLIPKDGIYAVKVRVDNEWMDGVMSIGLRPTFYGTDRRIEIHIFDFNHDVYGQKLQVHLVAFIRNEEKFNSTEELIAQMKRDEEMSRKILLNSGK
jgi:riboflavin kinase/FMN adenylyltransferase